MIEQGGSGEKDKEQEKDEPGGKVRTPGKPNPAKAARPSAKSNKPERASTNKSTETGTNSDQPKGAKHRYNLRSRNERVGKN